METKNRAVTIIKTWSAIAFLATVLFAHLLVTNGRLSVLMRKVPAINAFYEEQVKDIVSRPYIF